MGGCGGQRLYNERCQRWNTLCTTCASVKSANRRATRNAAAAKTAVHPAPPTPSTSTSSLPTATHSVSSLEGYIGVDPAEVEFIPRLLAAVKKDPVLMASWESEKDDLFCDIVLLKCRRKTKTSDLSKNVESLRSHLRLRVQFNTAAARDDILMHDRAISELPMFEQWNGSPTLCPVAVNHSNGSIITMVRECDAAYLLECGEDTLIAGLIPFRMYYWIILLTIVRRTRRIYRGTNKKNPSSFTSV